MFRTTVCSIALALSLILGLILGLTLGLGLNAVAAPACDDEGCQAAAPSKPLNIMQFMREQAASTRAGKPRLGRVQPAPKSHPVAHAQRPARRVMAARPKPAGLPIEAAASYAAQEPPVQVVASDELNDIDRAAPAAAAPAETTGTAMTAGANVQLVASEELNDIDRKAEDRLPLSVATRIADAHASARQPSVSWLQSIWSAVGNVFVALATAMHQLVGLVTHTA